MKKKELLRRIEALEHAVTNLYPKQYKVEKSHFSDEYPPDPDRWVECITDGLNCLKKGESYFVYHSEDDAYLILDDKLDYRAYSKKHFKPISKP